MRRRAFLLASAGAAFAHTYHTSISRIEHIRAAQSLEIMVWLHTEDVEELLRLAEGATATLDDHKTAARFVESYLRGTYEILTRAGKRVEWKWVGLEVRVHFLTVYLEAPAPSLEGLQLRNRVLMHLPDQVNVVKVRQDGKDRNDLEYRRGTPATLPLYPDR